MKLDKQAVIDLVLETRNIILDEQAAENVTVKGAADYVTQVDFSVQAFMQKGLYELEPSIGFIAEEKENRDLKADGCYWILDPIDGTTNLIHHYGLSAVSLGLYEKGEITFGVVYNPFHGELFTAEKGKGAFLNGNPIHVAKREMKDSVISYGSAPYGKSGSGKLFQLFHQIFERCADFRRFGSAALDLCYVACGRSDAYLEENLKPWDYAAGVLILSEAGGVVSDWKGEKLPYLQNSAVLGAAPGVAAELKDMIIK